jgi:hypothetical protein
VTWVTNRKEATIIGWLHLALFFPQNVAEILNSSSFFFSTLNCIEHVLLWVHLGNNDTSVMLLLLSSLPLSCALEHTFWALEWMQRRASARWLRNLPPAATSLLTCGPIFWGAWDARMGIEHVGDEGKWPWIVALENGIRRLAREIELKKCPLKATVVYIWISAPLLSYLYLSAT